MRGDFSLRGALTRRLLVALMVLGSGGAVVTYLLTSSYANLAYDRALLDTAVSLAQQISLSEGKVRLDLPPQAKSLLEADQSDKVVYRATDLNSGRVLDQNANLGDLAALSGRVDQPSYRDAHSEMGTLRVVALQQVLSNGDRVLIEVGETLHKRNLLKQEIVIGLAVLVLAMVTLTVGLVWHGTANALAPLEALELEAASRSLDNLAPLSPGGAPREVRGLIDAINRLMERLAASIGLQQRFTANVAHQLRTPLAGLRLQAQLALKTDEPAAQREALLAIERDAARTSHIVDQLLSLAKAEVDGGRARETLDLGELGLGVVSRYVRKALDRHIDLGFEGVHRGVLVSGYPALLEELLANLVDNAILYTQCSGKVTVRVLASERVCELQVVDNGPGIAEEERQQVFQRFFRADTSAREGAGLGLAIVHEIAERHRARVLIETGEQARGCRFRVLFDQASAADGA
ncbi:sensor histidine kinase [Chitinimonas sp.]|uniref:sensor histidine kinase n=1 Tax=Chitinimonas sp. TaxID=1934313 RepID=UPI0035AF9BCE